MGTTDANERLSWSKWADVTLRSQKKTSCGKYTLILSADLMYFPYWWKILKDNAFFLSVLRNILRIKLVFLILQGKIVWLTLEIIRIFLSDFPSLLPMWGAWEKKIGKEKERKIIPMSLTTLWQNYSSLNVLHIIKKLHIYIPEDYFC